jgi:hypothetical protein
MFSVQPFLGHIPTDTVGPPAILHDTATLKNKPFRLCFKHFLAVNPFGKSHLEFYAFSFFVSKVTVPPRASVNLLTTANPKPWPFDFVVTRGVNNFSLISSEIATPES